MRGIRKATKLHEEELPLQLSLSQQHSLEPFEVSVQPDFCNKKEKVVLLMILLVK